MQNKYMAVDLRGNCRKQSKQVVHGSPETRKMGVLFGDHRQNLRQYKTPTPEPLETHGKTYMKLEGISGEKSIDLQGKPPLSSQHMLSPGGFSGTHNFDIFRQSPYSRTQL